MKRKHLLLIAALVSVVGLLAQSLYAVATEAGEDSGQDPAGGDAGALAVGADSGDLKFVPIEPCRLIDTRSPGAGGALAPNTTRDFHISGTTGFGTQGGKSTCGIPDEIAVAVTLNLTAVDPNGKGFMRAWPFGSPAPNATILNYSPTLNASNAATVAICDPNAGGTCTKDLNVRNFASTSHLVADAFGYFVEPMFAFVSETGTLSTNSRAVSSVRNGVGDYTVTFDRSLNGCVVAATQSPALVGQIGASAVGSSAFVVTSDSSGALADRAFQVIVVC